MRELAPIIIVIFAVFTVVFSFLGDSSYTRLSALKKSLVSEEEENRVLKARVVDLRRNVRALRDDDRELEKAARNELGLARPNEQIFIFDKKER